MDYKLRRKFNSIRNACQTLESYISNPNFDWNYAFKLSDKFRAQLEKHKEAIKNEPELMVALLKISERVSSEFSHIYSGQEREELHKDIKHLSMVKAGFFPSHENYLQYFEYVVKEREVEKLYGSLQEKLQKDDETSKPKKKCKI